MDCNICYSLFSESKPPYSGSCGHSFCLDCWKNSNTSNIFRCPLCKKIMLEDAIVKNYSIIDFLNSNDNNLLSSLIEKYEEINTSFVERIENHKNLKKEIEHLEKVKINLIQNYHNEAQEIVNNANRTARNIVDSAKELSNIVTDEGKQVLGIIDKLYIDIILQKDNLENSIESLCNKVDNFSSE